MQIVILVGIQGSGKSSFYKELFFSSHLRISLDMLKTRPREWKIFQSCIAAEAQCVIDNTNILRKDRERYITPGRHAGFSVSGYFFNIPLPVAMEQNARRTGKECIPVVAIRSAFRNLEIPQYDEGFDELFSVEQDPATRWKITAVPRDHS